MNKIRGSFAYDCFAVVGVAYIVAVVVHRYIELWAITHP